MKKMILSASLKLSLAANLLIGSQVNAMSYDNYEINQQLNQTQIKQVSTDYIQSYFSSKQPDVVIDGLLQNNMTPLEREYILFNLLTEISQQPPQIFQQKLIDRMKTYPVQATRTADEGHIPVAVFNLNSKAYGIENIWTTYRSEQRFNLLFKNNLQLAVAEIKIMLSQDSTQLRPQWLGVKNSITALAEQPLNQLSNYLLNSIQINDGLDSLISHVGLFTGHTKLIEKALLSNQAQIRELTLRKLSRHLTASESKTILLKNAQSGLGRKFSTSLLGRFSHDNEVAMFLINQLKNETTAPSAAFALGQSNILSLPQLLKKHYLLSQDQKEKNNLLLALKLNNSSNAKLALNDLLNRHENKPNTNQWLQSFERKDSGKKP